MLDSRGVHPPNHTHTQTHTLSSFPFISKWRAHNVDRHLRILEPLATAGSQDSGEFLKTKQPERKK